MKSLKLAIALALILSNFESLAYIGGQALTDVGIPTLAFTAYQEIAGTGIRPYQCSGVMVSPNLLLTAAHCVYPKISAAFPMLWIRHGELSTTAKVEAVYVLPEYKIGIDGQKLDRDPSKNLPDIAIVKLKSAASFPIAKIDFRPLLLPGAELTVNGYGAQSSFQDFHASANNDLRGGKQVFKEYNGPFFSTYLVEGHTGSGDSGAPVYLHYSNGSIGVVGVVSYTARQTFLLFTTERNDLFARVDDSSPVSIKMSKWFDEIRNGSLAPFYVFP